MIDGMGNHLDTAERLTHGYQRTVSFEHDVFGHAKQASSESISVFPEGGVVFVGGGPLFVSGVPLFERKKKTKTNVCFHSEQGGSSRSS